MSLERISIYVTPELKDWFKSESEAIGIRMSSYVSMILNEFKENKEGARALQYLKVRTNEIDSDETKEAIRLMAQLLKSQENNLG